MHTLTGEILAVQGPHQPSTHDLVVARHWLTSRIGRYERVLADGAYIGDSHFVTTTRHPRTAAQRALNSMRQLVERVISRVKVYAILSGRFRNQIRRHRLAFETCCKLVNYNMLTAPMRRARVRTRVVRRRAV